MVGFGEVFDKLFEFPLVKLDGRTVVALCTLEEFFTDDCCRTEGGTDKDLFKLLFLPPSKDGR